MENSAEIRVKWLKEQKRIMAFLHETFDKDCGQMTLDWISKECMEHEQTFVPDSERVTAFNEGKRSFILRLRAALAAKTE